jgi:hypothetical protein
VADTVAQLVAQVLEEGQFDATNAQALRWLTVRQRQLCRRSKWYRKTLSIGPTVDGQASYALPAEVVEILMVEVDGYVYGHMRHQDPSEAAKGWIWLGGSGGIAGRQDSSAGEQQLWIFPTPYAGGSLEPGKAVSVYAVVRPPDLVEGDDTTLVIPGEYMDALVEGAIATAMLRTEDRPDLAAGHEQIFTTACGELSQQSNRRYRGVGPAQIRVVGVNA